VVGGIVDISHIAAAFERLFLFQRQPERACIYLSGM
jgi:hypothetical protein